MSLSLISGLCLTTLLSAATGNTYLNVTGIRLAGGSGKFEGRVEVSINGIWGTICHNSFDMNDARVLCRTNGLSATAYFTSAHYGKGTGPIYAQELRCNGYESHIGQCTYVPNLHCNHNYDVGIICTACGEIQITNGKIDNISSNGTVLSTSCLSGFTSDVHLSVCGNNSKWSVSKIVCISSGYPLNISEMRLANGVGIHDGRVELLVNGIWGTICGNTFSRPEARVVCKSFGFSDVYTYTSSYRDYGQGSGPVYLSNLDCKGTETHINNCTYNTQPSCRHNYDIAVVCRYTLNVTDIRLVSDIGPYGGRVEVLNDDVWGTVCNRYMDSNEATTICKSLNLNLTFYFTSTVYGRGSGQVLVGNLACSSSHHIINDCNFIPPQRQSYHSDCDHSRDLSLICTECGKVNIPNGDIQYQSFNGTTLTATCFQGYEPDTVTLDCLENGTWMVEDICKLPYDYPLSVDDIRLYGGQYPHEGRIEIKVNNTWGTVCGSSFDASSGAVFCHMLGYQLKRTYYDTSSQRVGPAIIDKLQCNGTERHINNCSYEVPYWCNYPYYPSVECTGYQLNITGIRLAGTADPHHGRVEIEVNDTWGTICDNGFSNNAGMIICRMLGLQYYKIYSNAYFGEGSGPVYIDRLSCSSSAYQHLDYCKYSTSTSCQHRDDVSLSCFGNHLNITGIRLAGTVGRYHGRLEIEVNDTWGTVCHTNFGTQEGTVVCRMLGFEYYRYYGNAYYGQGSGPVHIDVLDCPSTVNDINDCKYVTANMCKHGNDISVLCYGNHLNITGIRLAGTRGPYHGRVEIEVNDTWGTICDTSFGRQEGIVVCRTLGLEYYTQYGNSYYGQGNGPVHIDVLDCPSSVNNINDCKYVTANMCKHGNDISVLCYGPRLNITDARLGTGTGPNDGRAEIKVNGTWGTICDNNFNINDANTFCSMLGLKAAQYFTGARHGEGTGPVYVDELFCQSYDTDLSDCRYLFRNSCNHDRDVSVVCNECGQPDIYYWDAGYFSYNGTTLYADCSYYKTYIGTLQMTCDNETKKWITEGQCQEYSYPLDIMDIRLIGGNRTSHGRVELKVMDTWGTVCDHGFRKDEANAICQMIGYAPAFEVYSGAHFGEGKGPIFVDDINCLPGSTHINNCTYVTYDNCQHSNDVSVICTDCGNPTPTNGLTNSTATSYGTVVEVSCEQGFRLIGNSSITCELSNSWSGSPTCKLIDCGDPKPEHGTSNVTSTTNGSVVLITCDTGYNLSGNALVTCQENEYWTDYPTCEIVDCGKPFPENADVTLPGNMTTYEEIAVISCLLGYRPDGSSTVSCLANAKWEAWPACEIIDCGDPTPNKGQSNDTETTYGTVVSIKCDEGFNITGISTIICQADGTWSDTPVCDSSDCGVLSVSYGQVNMSDKTTVGSMAYVKCNRGYELKGSPLVACTSVGWNDSVSCIKQDCGDPTPENGKVVHTDGTEYGSVAETECNIGTELIGEKVITCQDGGIWSDNPKCKIRDCGHQTLPNNAKWDNSEGTEYNATITFECVDGFHLVGEESIVCQSTGEWNSLPPECVEKAGIGGPCSGDEYCHTENAVCVNSICSCRSNVNDERTNKCDTMPLLPYGEEQGDITLPPGEGCGKKISFAPGIPLYDKLHKDLYVCSNGLVSFDGKYTNPTPPKDRQSLSEIKQKKIIAPFYSPIDKSSGSISYRTYDILNSYQQMEDDKRSTKSVILYLEKMVKTFGQMETFEASFILLATWDSVRTSNIDYDGTKTSTFQAVLISDGTMTFTMFIYGHGLMQWRHKGAKFPQIWVGYSVNTSSFYTHPFSFFPNVLGLDKVEQSLPISYFGVAGLVFQPLTNIMVSKPNYAVECIRWYNENLEEKQKSDIIASRLPDCPCDIWLSRFDPWFWNIRRWLKVPYTCVSMFPGQIYQPYGKSCCYDLSTWLWTDRRPVAGNFYRYHPKYYIDHYTHDLYPKEVCCKRSNYCKLYYDLRPTGACYRNSPYDFGIFWGDPHFRTLDGLNFTFNGLGEYTLLQVRTENITFDLQARTERAIKKDGTLSDATVFSAFAAKESSGASVHVELNRAKSGLNLYGNNVDLTELYNSHADPENPFSHTTEDGNLVISKRDETLAVLFPFSGVSLNISASVEMLSLSTIVPQKLRNITAGLLGNYDGDVSNDFMMANGTVLNSNISEREVFAYGKTWTINPNNSAFVYNEGKSNFDYHNESYVPRFLDEVDPVKRTEAENACNGSQNIECVFDLVFTERTEIAEDANRIKGQAELTRQELDESVPSIKGCDTVSATKGNSVTCTVTLEEGTTLYFIENNASAKYDHATSTVSYIQEDESPVEIRFSANNSKNRSSPSFIMSVLLCTGCSGRGNCTDEPRDDPRETDYFKYATCICQPEYEGLDCENEFDGCAANPCSFGRNCTTLPASEQRKEYRAYECGPCPSGFLPNNKFNDECLDKNECKENVCEHDCINTEGSYECSCNKGYRVDCRKSSKCRDINECNEATHNCSHICNNTVGGYSCQCFPGYTHNDTTWTCDASYENDAPCSKHELEKCSKTDGCIKENGTSRCFCASGYELDETERACQDIDECKRNVCPQDCTNTNGSFKCTCFVGYQLQGPKACKVCDVPQWGFNCSNMCECTGQGTDRCDPVRGCICATGWTGDRCNIDIDECQLPDGVCKDPKKKCYNNLGSFRCNCRQGYIETADGLCEDFDECSNALTNECMQSCINTVVGYTCGCLDGFTRLNETHCKDINECELGTAGCEQVCKNSPGLYSCYCHFGYTLNDDRKTCSKISDPCKTIFDLDCSHYCVINDEKATCKCKKGYMLGRDEQTCLDINECTNESLNLCAADAECINTDGSFKCKCPVGTKLENDRRTCSVCDQFHFGEECSQNCSCLHGHCDSITGCVCEPGWGGRNCDVDRDECANEELTCKGANVICLNIPGSAMCNCMTGFNNVSGICKDTDECENASLNNCDQECINTEGSYKCACRRGFVYQDETCTDINECLHSDQCDQICENTVGSYRCICEKGFRLNLTDRKSCIVDSVCQPNQEEKCKGNATCFVINGEAKCSCNKGYSGDDCEDIDECSVENGLCSQHCNNTLGSFICHCRKGFYLVNDRKTCQECSDGQFGHECESTSKCNPRNTDSCDIIDGKCSCKEGWKGDSCTEDINECESKIECQNHSKCENKVGSYNCKCLTGYYKTGTGHCEECDSRKYGENCKEACKCSLENTASCDNVNGACLCKTGWNGSICSENINECDSGACRTIPNSKCEDTDGSNVCACEDGFEKQGDSCIDADECLRGEHNCGQDCVNTPGSHQCKCWKGFLEAREGCKRCTSNTFGENCSEQCRCKIENSADQTQTCDTETGQCMCLSNWQGETCNDDVDECQDESRCKDDKNTECQNNIGWYSCECVEGYKGYRVDEKEICIKDDPIMIDLTVKIDVELPDGIDIKDPDIKANASDSLYKFYGLYTHAQIVIHITDIREHQTKSRSTRRILIIGYTVAYEEDDASVASALTAATIDVAKGTFILFGGKNTKFTTATDSFKDMEPCDVYRQTVGYCEDGYQCVLENNNPICRLRSTDTNLPLIIGVSAGGLLLVTIVVMIVCLRKRREKRKEENRLMKGGKEDSEESKYMTWKSMASRFTVSSGNGTNYSGPFQIPRARTQHSSYSNPDYISPRI